MCVLEKLRKGRYMSALIYIFLVLMTELKYSEMFTTDLNEFIFSPCKEPCLFYNELKRRFVDLVITNFSLEALQQCHCTLPLLIC